MREAASELPGVGKLRTYQLYGDCTAAGGATQENATHSAFTKATPEPVWSRHPRVIGMQRLDQ